MTDTLISLDTAILAKEKGFDWPTNAVHARLDVAYLLPTQALLAKWLREQYIYIIIKKEIIGSDEWVWAYRIEYLPKDKQGAKRRCLFFLEKESYKESPGGTYWGGWDTFEEALENALKHSLELL